MELAAQQEYHISYKKINIGGEGNNFFPNHPSYIQNLLIIKVLFYNFCINYFNLYFN